MLVNATIVNPCNNRFRINANKSINVGLANSLAVQEQQNAYAKQTGIDYWAFCAYPLFCNDTNPPDSECVNIQCCQGILDLISRTLASVHSLRLVK
jgi:hypothetical protein